MQRESDNPTKEKTPIPIVFLDNFLKSIMLITDGICKMDN